MICQCYVPTLERAFNELRSKGLLDKQIFCYVLDRALYATRCGAGAKFRPNNNKSPRYIEPFCRSNEAEKRRKLEPQIREKLKGLSKEERKKELSTIAVTKEHVVPESVLWNLFRVGTPTGELPNEGPPPPRTPVSVIAALYNVAFVTPKENKRLSAEELKSRMPKGWLPPQELDKITKSVVWARYEKAGLFKQMKQVADCVGD